MPFDNTRHWERYLRNALHTEMVPSSNSTPFHHLRQHPPLSGGAGLSASSSNVQTPDPIYAHQEEQQVAHPESHITTYQVRVYFRVAINTAFGHTVRVVGGWPKLGNWDPTKGMELTTTDEVFPVWFSREPVYLPLKLPIYYQYVVVNDQTNEVISWEASKESRKIIPTGYEMTIEDDEGLYRTLTRGGTQIPRTNLRSPLFRMRDQQLAPPADMNFLGEDPKGSSSFDHTEDAPKHPNVNASLASYLQNDSFIASGKECPELTPLTSNLTNFDEASLHRDTHQLDPVKQTEKPDALEPTTSHDALDAIRRLREIDADFSWDSDSTLVVVCFELPVKVFRRNCPSAPSSQNVDDLAATPSSSKSDSTFEVIKSNALLMPGLHRIRKLLGCNIQFVGYPGINAEDEEEQEMIRHLLAVHDCHPVFPSREEFDAYVMFCQNILQPLFHSVIDLDLRLQEPFSTSGWTAYQAMNKLWANEAASHYTEDSDMIWVHDYQLLLVPQYVSRKYKRANVGLFLHTPFPNYDLFRCIPVRGELLRGMLCSDLIGFHFFEYARHFLVSNKRLLGLDHVFSLGGFLGVEYGGRTVTLKISHVNVEYNDLRRYVQDKKSIQRKASELRAQYEGKFILGAVDRCDQLAGLLLKLKGFHSFLTNFPYARNKVILVQYAYPTRHNQQDAMKLENELRMLANKINSEFGPEPHVDLHIQAVSPSEKYAILTEADCLLETSIRDGLNLVAFEYIGCRLDKPSFLILSEFAGCSSAIASPIRVNPWQLEDVAAAMDKVMSSPSETQAEKWHRDQLYLSQRSLTEWAREFMMDLRRSRKTEAKVYMQCGFASTFRVLTMNEGFKPLDLSRVVRKFRGSTRRLLFFDHEGTLAPDRRHLTVTQALSSTGTPPLPAVKAALTALATDSDTYVVILSGRDKKCLEEWFGDVPGIGLCAEHGFYAKIPPITGDKWHCMSETVDLTWKQIAMELMLNYTKRTQGAFVENKGSALVFQYRDADPDFGSWQAKELAAYLEEFLFGQPVSVIAGKGYVELKLRGVSKGVAVEHVMTTMSAVFGEPQFILSVGDDRSDEDMFLVVNDWLNEHRDSEDAVFTVTVGKKPTAAKYYLNDPEEVSELLNLLQFQTSNSSEGIVDAHALVEGVLQQSSSEKVEKPGLDAMNGLSNVENFWPGSSGLLEEFATAEDESSNGDRRDTDIHLHTLESRYLEELCLD